MSRSPVESEVGVYIDASALVKVYVPEAESDRVDEFLRNRNDRMISELSLTEVVSAVARRRREAESVSLRTLDALHVALAISGGAKRLLTFDPRMADAAALHGLLIVDLR